MPRAADATGTDIGAARPVLRAPRPRGLLRLSVLLVPGRGSGSLSAGDEDANLDNLSVTVQ